MNVHCNSPDVLLQVVSIQGRTLKTTAGLKSGSEVHKEMSSKRIEAKFKLGVLFAFDLMKKSAEDLQMMSDAKTKYLVVYLPDPEQRDP